MNKKKLIFTILLVISFVIIPTFVYADLGDIAGQSNAFAGRQGADVIDVRHPLDIIYSIINIALSVVGIMLVSYLVYGGYLIMTAGGEEDKVLKGKNTIKNAVIGVFLALMAYSITIFVTYVAMGGYHRDADYFEMWIQDRSRSYYQGDPFAPSP